ncbi:MAG TPA: type VI secretion system baseplate subunit TssG, partial [Longimicrobiales bacterium]
VASTDQCALGDDEDASSQLGIGSLVGNEVWDQQCKVRVRIGPLPRRRYDEFLPGGTAHEPLRQLLRFFSRDQLDFELQLVLARDDVPALVLGGAASPPLGWTTWIRSAPLARDPDETVLAL